MIPQDFVLFSFVFACLFVSSLNSGIGQVDRKTPSAHSFGEGSL